MDWTAIMSVVIGFMGAIGVVWTAAAAWHNSRAARDAVRDDSAVKVIEGFDVFCERLQAGIGALSARMTVLEAERDKLLQQVLENERKQAELRVQMAENLHAQDALRVELDSVKAANAELLQRIQEQDAKIAELSAENIRLRACLASLEPQRA